MQAAATTSWLGTKRDLAEPLKPDLEPVKPEPAKPEPAPAKQAAREVSQYPVAWVIGEPHVQISSSGSEGFLISGTNVAEQALEQVHAVLKPDRQARNLISSSMSKDTSLATAP